MSANETTKSFQELADSTQAIIDAESSLERQFPSVLYYCSEFHNIEPNKTLTYAQSGLTYARETRDTLSASLLLKAMGSAKRSLGDMDGALADLQESLALSIAIKDSITIARVYRVIGVWFQAMGDQNTGRSYALKSIAMGEKIGDSLTVMLAMHSYAGSYQANGDYLKSIELYEELIIYCEENQLDSRGPKMNMARAMHNTGKISEAMDLFFEVRNEFAATNDHREVAMIDHHIGYILKLTGLYEEALQYYSSVNDYFSEHYDVSQLSVINENLGELMMSLEKPEEAKVYFKKGLAIKQESGIKSIGVVLQDIGLSFQQQNDLDSTKYYFDQSLAVFQELDDQRGIGSIYNSLAGFHLKIGEVDNGLKYAKDARIINQQYQIKRELLKTYEHLSALFEKQGQLDSALAVKNQYEILREELEGPEELLKITKKVIIETLKANEDAMSSDNEILRKLLAEENLNVTVIEARWIYLGLFGFVIIGTAIFFLIRKKRREPKNVETRKAEHLQLEEATALSLKLNEVMAEEKPFLNEELTLKELAEALNTSDKKLSMLLNQHLETNFYDYLNKLRVEAFIEKLKSKTHANYSMIGLASESGFKSKSSFYRIFNKEKGMSPSAFKSQLNLKETKGG